MNPDTSSWAEPIRAARELPRRWDLHLIADVMEELADVWESVVETYIGVAGAYFWRQGDRTRGHEVRMFLSPAGRPRKDDPVIELLYLGDTGAGGVTAADKCRPDNAAAVLTAFLYNLANPDAPPDDPKIKSTP